MKHMKALKEQVVYIQCSTLVKSKLRFSTQDAAVHVISQLELS